MNLTAVGSIALIAEMDEPVTGQRHKREPDQQEFLQFLLEDRSGHRQQRRELPLDDADSRKCNWRAPPSVTGALISTEAASQTVSITAGWRFYG